MFKKLALISLATSIAFAPMAMVQAKTSSECSKEANAKGLHGKPRQKFLSQCAKGMKGPR